MFKGLTKKIGLLLLLLFISTSIVIPILHKAHCDAHSASGKDNHCAICQVIHTPCIISQLPLAVIGERFVVGTVQPNKSTFLPATLCNLCQARAPPVV